MGFFGPSKEELAAKKAETDRLLAEAQKVKVTTGDIKQDYEILKVVFQLGSDEGGALGQLFGTGGSPSAAFDAAEAQLKIQAHELGCDYVINTVFNQRIAVGGTKTLTGGYNQVIEVFSYGTAVKIK